MRKTGLDAPDIRILDAGLGIERYMTSIATRQIESTRPTLTRLVAPGE